MCGCYSNNHIYAILSLIMECVQQSERELVVLHIVCFKILWITLSIDSGHLSFHVLIIYTLGHKLVCKIIVSKMVQWSFVLWLSNYNSTSSVGEKMKRFLARFLNIAYLFTCVSLMYLFRKCFNHWYFWPWPFLLRVMPYYQIDFIRFVPD